MTRGQRLRSIFDTWGFVFVIVIVVIIFLLPFLWMIFSSFKTTAEIFRYTYPFSWKTLISSGSDN